MTAFPSFTKVCVASEVAPERSGRQAEILPGTSTQPFWSLLVEQGEAVDRGQTLGKVGDTGSLRGPYLYFELRQEGKPVDPAPWLERH